MKPTILQNKFFFTSVMIICLAAGTVAASYYLQRENTGIKSARLEDKPIQDSLKKSLPCNRYYHEVLMY